MARTGAKKPAAERPKKGLAVQLFGPVAGESVPFPQMRSRPLSPVTLDTVRAALLPFALLVGALLGSTGCASGKDAADRQIDRLRADVMRLETDQDRLSSRLTAIEMSGKPSNAPGTSAAAIPALSPATSERPALRVVVLKPGDDSAPSTETTTTDEGAVSGTVRATRDKEYDEAYALVKAKEYEKAIPALTGFLVRFPDHANADAAMFWIGASHAAKGDVIQAIEILEGVLARFPGGNKAPDALLELARAYRKHGDADRAEQAMARLRREFPRSDAAQRAPKS